MLEQGKILNKQYLESPLGTMMAISDDDSLYFLDFVDRSGLQYDIERFCKKTKSTLILGQTPPIRSIQKELDLYFKGELRQFKTKLNVIGSPFQKSVWHALMKIPYSETRSYLQMAKAIGSCTAYRAVANANGANKIVIVIPCHRVISSQGGIGGYSGGIGRKQSLLELERNVG